MKIAIINPSDEFEIGIKGGNQYAAEALARYIKKYTNHEVIKIFTPIKAHPETSLLKTYLMHRLIDLSDFDLVISLKFPSFVINHKNHVSYFLHFYRQFYDLWPQNENNSKLLTKTIRLIIKSIDKHSLKKIKKIYAPSLFIKSRLKETGIDSELLHLPPAEEDYKCNNFDYILSTSVLNEERKRISLLIKAMRYIKKDIKLVIVSEGPHKEQLMNLAKNDKRIIFLGYKPANELLDIYSNALCTCLVSYKEDYGLVTVESMKSKKPVITCTDSGGPLEFVEHNKTGLISEPNPKKIAENLNVLINNKNKAKILGENAYQRVKHINWKEVVDKIINKGL